MSGDPAGAHAGDPVGDAGVPPVRITWKPAGPIIVEGAAIYLDNAGTELVPPPAKHPGQVKLCGCGLSANKPFCDGSHKR